MISRNIIHETKATALVTKSYSNQDKESTSLLLTVGQISCNVQSLAGSVQLSKYVGELAMYNYHRDSLTLSPEGLIMYEGTHFLVPNVLRPGLLKALHSRHPWVMSMLLRANESFWYPGLKQDIENVRARCLLCHENAPSQANKPSRGVLGTKNAYEALSMDHLFLKGIE